MTAPSTDTVDALLASLTTRQKIAQLIMPWLLGNAASDTDSAMQEAYHWVRDLEVGGIIISTGTPEAIASKLNRLQAAAPLPLLIAADFEGGITMRVRAGTPFPTQMGVAAGGRLVDAYEMGRVTAIEGRAIGVQLAFAPDADVNSNPDNPIINTRSFGGEPHDVGRFVQATIEGLHAGGMLATAKHFPGHGDTEVDSHLSLPLITAPWSRFDTLELVPFRAAIAAGVDAIMSAHIAVPALDGGQRRPGTMSPAILTGILRDSLGFNGLVTTDALSMGAITREYGAEQAVVTAFQAGSDLLLMPLHPDQAIDAMVAAVESGKITMQRLDESVRRVLELKEEAGLFEDRYVNLDSVASKIRTPAALAAARAATQRSLVLLKDSLDTVKHLRQDGGTVTLIVVRSSRSDLGDELKTALTAGGLNVKFLAISSEPTTAQLNSAQQAMSGSGATIVATEVRWGSAAGSIGLTQATASALSQLARQTPIVLVSFGSPYIISQVNDAASYLIAWSATNFSERAVAQALLGDAAITGTIPITIPPNYPLRSGIRLGMPQ